MFNPSLYLQELKDRLSNPSVTDLELTTYLESASRQVREDDGWEDYEYREMILNSACQLLLVDNKFPEITSVASQGVSTSFSSNDSERFVKKLNALRQAKWLRQ